MSRSSQKSNKLWLGILGGAAAGFAISLLDKNTRKTVMTGGQKMITNVKSMAKDPNSVVENVKEMSGKIRTNIDQIGQDVSFISEKVDEMKEMPPQVAGVIKETKEVLVDKKSSDSSTSATENSNTSSVSDDISTTSTHK
jgi:hypothetical protein